MCERVIGVYSVPMQVSAHRQFSCSFSVHVVTRVRLSSSETRRFSTSDCTVFTRFPGFAPSRFKPEIRSFIDILLMNSHSPGGGSSSNSMTS